MALTTVVVITARMGSERFPGKSLAPLAGRPVLDWVAARCAEAGYPVWLALPATKDNDGLAAVAAAWGTVRRPDVAETDVLGRVAAVLSEANADIFVRVTGDCPMADPALLQEAVRCLEPGRIAYASNTVPGFRTFARGLDVEAMDVGLVSAAYQKATKGYDREHVTPWIQRYVKSRRLGMTVTQARTGEDGWQWSVDTPDDLAWLNRMAAVYMQHTGQPTLPPAQWLREYLHTHPDDVRHDTRLTLVR